MQSGDWGFCLPFGFKFTYSNILAISAFPTNQLLDEAVVLRLLWRFFSSSIFDSSKMED